MRERDERAFPSDSRRKAARCLLAPECVGNASAVVGLDLLCEW